MHSALNGHVRRLRVVKLPPGAHVERFPDGSSGMLLRLLGEGVGDLSVAGPRRRALFKVAPPAELSLVVEFEPGAGATFLGVPAHALADRYARIEDVWGVEGGRLRDRLLAARSAAEARHALELGLVDRLRRSPPTVSMRLAQRAVARLASAEPQPRIETLAAELGVSARHLRRVFTHAVGVGPKEYARMVRLQRVLSPSSSTATWTERALEAGYYDQAHFIADFRELMGTTPGRFARLRGLRL